MSAINYPEMVPIREAAKRTGLSYDILRQWCLAKKIVNIRAGRKFLINFGKLCEYLETAGVEEDQNE